MPFISSFTSTCTAPSLGPVLAGIIAEKLGWRWIFWFLAILSGVNLVALTLFLPETSRKLVLNGSKQARGVNRTVFSLLSKSRLPKPQDVAEKTSKKSIHIPNPLACILMLFHKGSLSVILVGSIYYTVSRSLAASLSAQCIDIYHLNYIEAGLVYLPSGIAGMISSYTTGKPSSLIWWSDQTSQRCF